MFALLASVIGILSLLGLAILFAPVGQRVRKIETRFGTFIEGSVIATHHEDRDYGDVATYWTIKWDDSPLIVTVPSWNFVWYDNYWTLVVR